jgi:hypothetical protein
MKPIITILLFFVAIFYSCKGELEKPVMENIETSKEQSYQIDNASIVIDSLNNLDNDSLQMLFGKWN